MKKIIKTVRDFISNEERKADLEKSKSLLMELAIRDRDLVDAIQLKAEFDTLFSDFLAKKRIEAERNLEKIDWYENN